MALRLLALVGSAASAVDRLVGSLLGFLPFRVPGALLVAVLLGLAAWGSAQETTRAIEARPRPVATTVGELVENATSAWVSVSGLISGPHLDNSLYAADRQTHFLRISDDPHDHVVEGGGEQISITEFGRRQTIFALTTGDGVTRWFYVLREADGGDRALVVRSARGGDAIRTRSVVAIVDGDVEGLPHLVERSDAGSRPATGSLADLGDGDRLTVRGAFTDGTEVACDADDACPYGAVWRYRFVDAADPELTAWIDSPHPPDALPVTLEGVVATDPTRLEIVLATEEMRAALDGLRHPDDLVLADGIRPAMQEVGYLGAFLLGGVAAVLAVSAAIRYPVFRRSRGRRAIDAPRPVVEELISVDVNGTLPGPSGAEHLSGTPARLGWLPGRELARRAWHLRNPLSDATDDRPRLALLAVEGSFVLPLEPVRDQLQVEPGVVATSAAVRHGLRLIGPGIRVVLGFGSEAERNRAEHELQPGVEAPAAGPIPEAAAPRSTVGRPWARTATAVALGLAAALVLSGSAVEILAGGTAGGGTAAAIAGSVALATLALGIARRHPLADELLPSAALLGLVVAGVVALASLGCGAWLSPNMTGCSGIDPVALVPPLATVIAFAIALWSVPHLAAGAPG
ncbi:MAG TPA: hypothetical protein VF364_02230 [Candidatus Limnocylindria bacterium]